MNYEVSYRLCNYMSLHTAIFKIISQAQQALPSMRTPIAIYMTPTIAAWSRTSSECFVKDENKLFNINYSLSIQPQNSVMQCQHFRSDSVFPWTA